MIETVLLPADPSDELELVARFAAGLGGMGIRKVVVAHVVDGPAIDSPDAAERADAAREQIGPLVEPLRDAGLETEVRISAGKRAAALLQMAHEEEVDAVVAATHGKGVAERVFLGSISEALASQSRIPVMLARYEALRHAVEPFEIASGYGNLILVPTDFSAASNRALEVAMSVVARTSGAVRLLTVTSSGSRPAPALEDLAARCKARGVRVSFRVRSGDPAEEIINELEASNATGIAMGTRGRTALEEALLGSVSLRVARQASCPVVIVR